MKPKSKSIPKVARSKCKPNIIYTSVKLRSTVKAIDESINRLSEVTKTINTRKTLRQLRQDVHKLKCHNTTLMNEIIPLMTKTNAAKYCESRLVSSGHEYLPHIQSALVTNDLVKKIDTPNSKQSSHHTKIKRKQSDSSRSNIQNITPIPLDGLLYTLEETVRWLSVKTKIYSMNAKIKELIRMKCVPVSQPALYQLMRTYHDTGRFPDRWKTKGHPPVLTLKQFDSFSMNHFKSTGCSMSRHDIKTCLNNSRMNNANNQGISMASVSNVSQSTITNYKYLSAVNSNKKLSRKR